MLSVHLDGYRNVLGAALPLMAAAGHGRILGRHVRLRLAAGRRRGVRLRQAGRRRAHLAARPARAARRRRQRHVADRRDPDGHRRARPRPRRSGGGRRRRPPAACRSARCPQPEDLGPFGAHLVGEALRLVHAARWSSPVGPRSRSSSAPRLLEVVRTDGAAVARPRCSRPCSPARLAPAEAAQASGGGSNPRFGADLRRRRPATSPAPAARSCAVVDRRPGSVAAPITAALDGRGVVCTTLGTRSARGAWTRSPDAGGLDAVVVAAGRAAAAPAGERLGADPGRARRARRRASTPTPRWARAAADHAARPAGRSGW